MAKPIPRERDALVRTDLYSFVIKVFETLSPTTPFLENWHIELLCLNAQAIVDQHCPRLIVNAPPRSLKSIIFSVALPAFLLGHNPSAKIICASYSDAIAGKLAFDFRRVVNAAWYKRIFPGLHIDKDTEAETSTTAGGFRLTTSVGGSLTGRGGDIIIVDDPLNASETDSKTSRERVNDWFRSALLSRLDNPTLGTILIVMQRLHMDDLSGILLAQGGWKHLSLPAIAPEDRTIALGRNRTFTWRGGQSLHPERLPLSYLASTKSDIGSAAFSAQYLQNPIPAEGNLLKQAWLRYVNAVPQRQQGDQIVQSWDTAYKIKETNDYSVGLTFLIRGKNEVYLLDVVRERLEFAPLKDRIIREADKWQATAVLIEEQASGTSLIQYLRSQVRGLRGIKPEKDKYTRAAAITPLLEGAILHLPRGAHWQIDFQEEYLAFPHARHDDQVDALTQFLGWIAERRWSYFEADFGINDVPRVPSGETILSLLGH